MFSKFGFIFILEGTQKRFFEDSYFPCNSYIRLVWPYVLCLHMVWGSDLKRQFSHRWKVNSFTLLCSFQTFQTISSSTQNKFWKTWVTKQYWAPLTSTVWTKPLTLFMKTHFHESEQIMLFLGWNISLNLTEWLNKTL